MDATRSGSRMTTKRLAAAKTAERPVVTDERLVDQALDGDREAFGSLVERHQRGLIHYLFRLTGSRDAATDLAQEVFIRVFQSLDAFDSRYRFTTWLYRIASNCAIDHFRKKQPRTFSLSQVGPDDEGGCEPPLQGTDPSPHDMLRLRELESRLEVSIRELPRGYRQLILLRHRQHLRYDEIARVTHLPIGTVKNRLFRAREILRKRLADLLDAEN